MKRSIGPLMALTFFFATPALADGYYICTSGSSCGQYCRYSGADNAENRRKCKQAGCRIGGTRSSTPGSNVKVCSARLATPDQQLAALEGLTSGSPAERAGKAE